MVVDDDTVFDVWMCGCVEGLTLGGVLCLSGARDNKVMDGWMDGMLGRVGREWLDVGLD